MIALTYFRSLTDPSGESRGASWEKLCAWLSRPLTRDAKQGTPGFSVATYREDRRAKDRVEHVFAVGLDFDHLDALSLRMRRTPGLVYDAVDWDALTVLFDRTDSFLHTTWSSTSDAPRARVFIRLSRPVTGAEYVRVWRACADRVEGAGLIVDRQASDPSRFWYRPAVRPGIRYQYSIGRGRPVNVDWALATVPETPSIAPPPRSSGPRVANASGSNVEERAAKYVDRCAPAISGQGGHTTTFKLAMKLVQGFALDEETTYRIMLPWNAQCQPPWTEHQLRRKIRQAAERGRMPEGALRDAQRRAS